MWTCLGVSQWQKRTFSYLDIMNTHVWVTLSKYFTHIFHVLMYTHICITSFFIFCKFLHPVCSRTEAIGCQCSRKIRTQIRDLKNDYAGSIQTSDWKSTWDIYVKFSTMPTDMFSNTSYICRWVEAYIQCPQFTSCTLLSAFFHGLHIFLVNLQYLEL